MSIDLRTLAGWTPSRLLWQEGHPFVEWCQFGRRRWSEAFFDQDVRVARAAGCPLRLMPAEVLDAWADTAPELPVAGLIFHSSRCGSTLITRMLGAISANLILSEAETISEVLAVAAELPGDAHERRIRWLRGLVHAYATRRFADEQRLIIKLDPWQTLDAAVYLAAFPDVPSIFVYRDPVEILVSLSDNVARAFTPTSAKAARMGLTFMEALSMSSEEYCARALGSIAAAAANQNSSQLLVNYTQLPGIVETKIAPFFGLTLDVQARVAMQTVVPFHAKAQKRMIFEADSARKQRDADTMVRSLVQRWIVMAYEKLEAQRQLQRC